VNVFRESPDHKIMIKAPETVGNITLDKPGCPGPGLSHVPQCGMASPTGTETVRIIGELRLVIRLKQQADHLAEQLIRPCGDGDFILPILAVAFGDHALLVVVLLG